MKNKIILLASDPNSINSEIISKTWKKINPSIKKQIYLIANYDLINSQFKKIKTRTPIIKIKNFNDRHFSKKLKIIDIPLKFSNPYKVPLTSAKKYISSSFKLAHKLALNKNVKGIVNCPLDKKLLHKTKTIGVTELLSLKCKILNGSEVMLIYNKKLSVVPITTHIDIRNVPKKLKSTLIINKMRTLKTNYKKIFNTNPKIGVLGLNPHNAEFSKKSEEVRIIHPAIKKLKKEGFKIDGPLSADTFFVNKYKKYDVVVGMYHDQVLAPFKSMFQFDAINITLGLKYVRVSPDHGPAKDIVAKNKGDHLSLLKCINFINKLKR